MSKPWATARSKSPNARPTDSVPRAGSQCFPGAGQPRGRPSAAYSTGHQIETFTARSSPVRHGALVSDDEGLAAPGEVGDERGDGLRAVAAELVRRVVDEDERAV